MASERYIELMNARYQRILATAWGEPTLECRYDGEQWSVTIAVRPAPARDRWVSGDGVTFELALTDLEQELGLERWTG